MNNKFIGIIFQIAKFAGTLSGRYSGLFSKFKVWLFHYLIVLLFVTAAAIVYVEIGHDKAWPRAERWYTGLHTYHHFPWQ